MTSALLAQWLERLEALHPKEIDLGLDRVATVARDLDLLNPDRPVITVAGTNGKGSVIATLEALLIAAGRRTGAYTSPHILRFNERIRVAGEEVSDGDIVHAFERIDVARGDTSLTYFEFATLAALYLFRQQDVDIVLLEVGLGGRLDAVNVIDATVAVITSIDMDHQHWLGQSLDEIAGEKAGILRAGRPAVIGEVREISGLQGSVQKSGAEPVYWQGRDYRISHQGDTWSYEFKPEGGKPHVVTGLPRGPLLPQNIATGLTALAALGALPEPESIPAVVAQLSCSGRHERRSSGGCEFWLDVAHNPAAVGKLHEKLSATPCNGKRIAIFSAMSDKDISGMLEAAEGLFDAWFLGEQPGNPRAAGAGEIADLLREQGCNMVSVSKNLRQAYRRARSVMRPGDHMVVFGSFFTLADVLPQLDRDFERDSEA